MPVIVVANPKGGVHKTTATVLCAATIGAIASKNASALSSVSSRMASASGAEVRGPVATMTFFAWSTLRIGMPEMGEPSSRAKR